MDMNRYEKLCIAVGADNVLCQEEMSKHTTFRIGGAADYFVTPEKKEDLIKAIEVCRREGIAFYIIGNGSNLLVGDRGYRGAVIQVFKKMNTVRVEGSRVYAEAGALLSKVAAAACDASLTGMEFASGIPGTIGGAVRMNAGAYGGEMSMITESAEVFTPEGELLTIPVEELGMAYRTSVIARKNYIVLGVVLRLEKGDEEQIRGKMEELKERRVAKQPLEFGSAGSTFKRPAGYFAGKLIQDAGLRGYTVGGAQVSEKHCGFVINRGNATAADVVRLMEDVADRVEERFGVRLEPEVKKLGEF